jgi:hypothetical protein
MNVVDPGHVYDLDWLDGQALTMTIEPEHTDRLVELELSPSFVQNRLIFVKRDGPGYPGNVGHHPGTNMQEVLRALIDRVRYLDQQVLHPNNTLILAHLQLAIFYLEERAAERHHREPTFDVDTPEIEKLPVCAKCRHIGCNGQCHGESG